MTNHRQWCRFLWRLDDMMIGCHVLAILSVVAFTTFATAITVQMTSIKEVNKHFLKPILFRFYWYSDSESRTMYKRDVWQQDHCNVCLSSSDGSSEKLVSRSYSGTVVKFFVEFSDHRLEYRPMLDYNLDFL